MASFFKQDLKNASDEDLARFYYEHELKIAFSRFVEVLRLMTFENLTYFQKLGIRLLVEILGKKAEQEKTVL